MSPPALTRPILALSRRAAAAHPRALCTPSQPPSSGPDASAASKPGQEQAQERAQSQPQSQQQQQQQQQTEQQDQHATPDETRAALHAAVRRAVPQHGWTRAAVSAGLAELGWSPAAAALLPRGVGSVLETLESDLDRDLASHLQEVRRSDGRTGNGGDDDDEAARAVAYAVSYRLDLQDPWHASWRGALALRARGAAQARGAVARDRLLLADELAHHARLGAADMSWYADRAAVAALYQAAELYWTAAAGGGSAAARAEATRRFVDARAADAFNARRRLRRGLAGVAGLSDAAVATAASFVRAARGSY